MFVNDLHNALESEARLFADDMCLLVKGSNPDQLKVNLCAELHHFCLWCSVNTLSINSTKSNIVIIPPKRTKARLSHLNLSSSRTLINIVSSTKYLGVITVYNF